MFRARKKWMPAVDSGDLVKVRVTEEKGTDVNLGTDLVWDACHRAMDCALVLCNDYDLQRPIDKAMEAGVEVLVVNPHAPGRPAVEGSGTASAKGSPPREQPASEPDPAGQGRADHPTCQVGVETLRPPPK